MSSSTSPLTNTKKSRRWNRIRFAVRAALLAGCFYLLLDICWITISWVSPRPRVASSTVPHSPSDIKWEIPKSEHPQLKDLIPLAGRNDFEFSWKNVCEQFETSRVTESLGTANVELTESIQPLLATSNVDSRDDQEFRWADLIDDLLPSTSPGVQLTGHSKSQGQFQLLSTTDSSLDELCEFWVSHQWSIEQLQSPSRIKLQRGSVQLMASYWSEASTNRTAALPDERMADTGFVRFVFFAER